MHFCRLKRFKGISVFNLFFKVTIIKWSLLETKERAPAIQAIEIIKV